MVMSKSMTIHAPKGVFERGWTCKLVFTGDMELGGEIGEVG